jgi:hypothetical protein
MAKCLEVIKFRDIARVKKINRFVSGQVWPTVELQGDDFTSVEKVYINDVEVQAFTVINNTTMWALVPNIALQSLNSVEVVSSRFTKTNVASRVIFEIGTRPKTLDGILRLVQLYTKWLLQSPGSDIFNPTRGGGMQDIVGTLVDIDRMDHVLSSVTRAVENTSKQIRAAQAVAKGLPLSERLLEATLVDMNKIQERMEIQARINIISMAGDEAISALAL